MAITTFETPDAAEQAFYQAFKDCDSAAMGSVWDDSSQTLCVHPGGPLIRATGAILQSWQEIFSNTSPPHIEHRLLLRKTAGDIAIHTVEEAIRPSGSSSDVTRIIASIVYENGSTGWHLISHHASLPLMAARHEGVNIH